MNKDLKRLCRQADLQNQVDPFSTIEKKQLTELSENTNTTQISKDTVTEINQLLNRIKELSNNLKDIYYVLFDNLNSLYQTYPSIYKQLQMTVKLPQNQDAMNIVQLNTSLAQALNKFKDPIYLQSYISNSSETL